VTISRTPGASVLSDASDTPRSADPAAALPHETVTCNLCGMQDADAMAPGGAFPMVRCRGCGLVYLNPRPTAGSLLSLYVDYHARHGQDRAAWDRLMDGVFREAAEVLCKTAHGPGPRRLLDVGCGFGGFIAMMQRRGWEVEGLDPSPTAVAAAHVLGRPVRLGTLDALRDGHQDYDAVTMFYVLEHLPDPMGTLRQAWSLLGPGKTLLLRVPHTTPIVRLLAPLGVGGALYDPPFHLYDFSPGVLRTMLQRVGFEDIRTFPGQPTLSPNPGARVVSAVFGGLANGIHVLTGGAVLLPGVSKTTIARKPSG
jgi:SAM-dependent methyltransferase